MDDDKVSRILRGMAKLMVRMESELLELQASVTVLKLTLARVTREDPQAVLDHMREAEQKALAGVPVSRQLQELTEVMDLLDKHGESFGKNKA
jgi:hypothetical protein